MAELGSVHLTAENAKVDSGVQKPIGILANEGGGEGSELTTSGPIKKSYESEVVKADLSISGDEQIAGVGITVEDAENEDLVQVCIDKILCELRALRPNGWVVDSPASASLLHDDRLANETIDDARDMDRGPISKGRSEALYVTRFVMEIDLLAQVAPDLLDDPQGLIMLQARGHCYGNPRCHHERPHVAINLRLDADPADLHDDLASILKLGRVDLGDRGCGDRLPIELGKELVYRAA